MLEKIITDFIYNKGFKNKKLSDIKKFYSRKLISDSKVLILLILPFVLSVGNLSKIILDYNLFFNILLSAGIVSFMFGMSFIIYNLLMLFNSETEMEVINGKKINLKYIKSENGESLEVINEGDFIKKNAMNILNKNLKSENLLFLTEEFKKAGINEEYIKDFLKERVSKKDKFNITLEDFCFLVNKIKERKSNEEKLKKTEIVLNNILNGTPNKEKIFDKVQEEEKILA